MKKGILLLLLLAVFLCLLKIEHVKAASESAEENNIYDTLEEKVKSDWYSELDRIQNKENTIEIKGNLMEKIIYSIVNVFYKNIKIIKVSSLLIGLVSFVVGGLIAFLSNLNKSLRRFAISRLMIGIPIILFIFVYGISILIGMFK